VRDAVTWQTSGVFDAVASGRTKEASLRARFAPAACEPALSNGGVKSTSARYPKTTSTADKSTRLPPKLVELACELRCAHSIRVDHARQPRPTRRRSIATFTTVSVRTAATTRSAIYSLNVEPAGASADSFARLYRTDSTTANVAWSSVQHPAIRHRPRPVTWPLPTVPAAAGPGHDPEPQHHVTVDAVIAPPTPWT
jgi:hypothetical protein